MSGFGSFFGNTSNKEQKTLTRTENNYASTGMENITGPAIAGSGNTLNMTTVDGGAVGDAFDFAGRIGQQVADNSHDAFNFGADALAANMEISSAALDVANRGNLYMSDLAGQAINSGEYLAGRGIDAVERANDNTLVINRDSLDFGRDSLNGALDAVDMGYSFADRAGTRATNFASDALLMGESSLRDALAYGKSMFTGVVDANQKATAANMQGLTALARETSASADDRVSKVAVWALMAVAAVFVLPAIFKGRAA